PPFLRLAADRGRRQAEWGSFTVFGNGVRTLARAAHSFPGVFDDGLVLVPRARGLLFPNPPGVRFHNGPGTAPARLARRQAVAEAEGRREVVVGGAARGEVLRVEAAKIRLVVLERANRWNFFDLHVLPAEGLLDGLDLLRHFLAERHFLDD